MVVHALLDKKANFATTMVEKDRLTCNDYHYYRVLNGEVCMVMWHLPH